MKKFLRFLIYLLILGAIVYQYRAPLEAKLGTLQDNFPTIFGISPCSQPIPYTLGTFDNKFGISQAYFLSALADAEAIWEKPFGKQFFTYVPDDKDSTALKINLVYDYRQEATTKLATLGVTVKDDQASYDSLKAQFTALKAQYDKADAAYNTQVDTFNTKEKAYEDEVDSWNQKGGAPQAEYDKIQDEKVALDAESKDLQTTQTNINNMVDEINALATELNSLAATLNISADNYNTVSSARGESFEEGVYSQDGSNREIDIYEYSDRTKLVRVLAHELGHALGLGHVDDPAAIMYKLNQGNSEALTAADIAALKAQCGLK